MTESKRQQYIINRKKRKHKVLMIKIVLFISICIAFIFTIYQFYSMISSLLKTNEEHISEADADSSYISSVSDEVADPIDPESLPLDEYPAELIKLLQKNPETEEFVLNYPTLKGTYSKESLTEALNQNTMPLLMQWDSRWGYYEYSSSLMGVTGCGPVCLSMVAIHLLQNEDLTPIYMADYAVNNGYCVPGSGTAWELMSTGAEGLGLKAEEVPLDENIVKRHLENGNPIICIMGEGIFTDDGHFIVFTGLEDGKITINDPNSKERSEQLWEFENIQNQIRNMWVYRIGN